MDHDDALAPGLGGSRQRVSPGLPSEWRALRHQINDHIATGDMHQLTQLGNQSFPILYEIAVDTDADLQARCYAIYALGLLEAADMLDKLADTLTPDPNTPAIVLADVLSVMRDDGPPESRADIDAALAPYTNDRGE